jgi:hypothetical protein
MQYENRRTQKLRTRNRNAERTQKLRAQSFTDLQED